MARQPGRRRDTWAPAAEATMKPATVAPAPMPKLFATRRSAIEAARCSGVTRVRLRSWFALPATAKPAPPMASRRSLARDGRRMRDLRSPVRSRDWRPAHDLSLLISRCIGARSRRERPSRRPVQIRPPNIGTRLAAAACGSCGTRRARRIVCLWAASRCRSSMRAVASARLRWCIGPPIRTRICLSRVLTRPAGETRRRISSSGGVAVGVSCDARLRS
jgi:hypothetical protein